MKSLRYAVVFLIVLAAGAIPSAIFADGETLPEKVYDDMYQAVEATQDTHETAYYYARDVDTGQELSGKCGDNTTYAVYGRVIWEQETYEGQTSWAYSDSPRYLAVISGTGPTYDYTWETKLDKWDTVREIVVEDGVTTIGDNFFNMLNTGNWIEKVTLPEGLTSIGEYAFENSEYLESINLPDSVRYIGPYAFFCCRSLKTLHLPESLTAVQECSFYGLESIKSIEIPDSVTTIKRDGFESCSKLKTIKWGKGLKKIGDSAFACCGFTELSIPDHVTSIGEEAFAVCPKLKKVKVSKALTKIPDEAFRRCGKLTQITFPSSSKVTKIGSSAFEDCSAMKSITLPKKVKMIKDGSFAYCDKLRTIKLLGKKHPKLESYCVFTTDTLFSKKRTKNITFKCPNMSKKEKKKFRKYLNGPYMYFYGKVK